MTPWFWRRGSAAGGLLAWLLAWAVFSPVVADPQHLLEAGQKAGPQAATGVRDLLVVLAQTVSQDDETRLQTVNDFYNRRILFREDTQAWGQIDYWASPIETLARGQGDCEDYAIAKYFSLLAGGMAAHKLRLVYVRAVLGGPGGPTQAHMVLAYFATPDADPLILDNLVGAVRPASRRPDLTPVFSFNAEGLWQGGSGASSGDPTARLSRWREVLRKAREEGFF